jgi:hypothetical protein
LAAGAAAAGELVVELTDRPVSVGTPVTVGVTLHGASAAELRVAVGASDSWSLRDGPRPLPGAEPAWRLVLVPLATGRLALPRLEAVEETTSAADQVVAVAPETQLHVQSVLGEDDPLTAAPLAPPVGARGLAWEWLLPVLGAGLTLVGGVGLLWWWRCRRLVRPAAEAGSPLAEVEELAAALAGRSGELAADEVCDRLATALRRLLGHHSGEPAAEMTALELDGLCRRQGWPVQVRETVTGVMAVADGVRFARRPVEDSQLAAVVDQALAGGRILESEMARRVAAAAAPGEGVAA